MRVRSVLFCAALSITFSGTCFAARNVEVIQHPSLLMLGDVTQVVGVSYSFTDHAGLGATGTSHSLSERYTLSTTAAIFDPDIATIQLDAGLVYQQTFSSSSANFLNGQYDMVLSGLITTPYPFTISSSRDTSLIATGYTPAYTLTTMNNQVSVSLLHNVLPFRLSYAHGSSDSSGLAQDYSSTSDVATLSVSHNYEDRSISELLLSYVTTDVSNGRNSRAYTLNVDNRSTLDKASRYSLSTRLQLQDLKPVDVPQRTVSFSEALTARFGAALLGSLSYDFSDSSTTDFNGASQSLQTNSATASLSHRLFASLTTSLAGSYSSSDGFGGNSTSYGGSAGVNYYKMLPAQSALSANFTYSRKITDQKVTASEVSVRDEQHHVTQQGEIVRLNNGGTVASVVTVKSLNPDTTYTEGVDYRVNLAQGSVEIVVGGGIAPGTDLLISYIVRLNPSISFQSDSYTTGCVLTLFNGRYTLGGDYSTLNETLLSGQPTSAPLSQSTNYTFRGEARYGAATFGADYANSDNTSQSFSRAGAHMNYTTVFSRTDSFSFNAREDYFMYPASKGTSVSYDENTVSAGATYGTRFFDFVRSTLSFGVSDNRSRFGSGQVYSVRASANADYRRLSLACNVMTLYRVTNQSTNRDTNVNISITRSF